MTAPTPRSLSSFPLASRLPGPAVVVIDGNTAYLEHVSGHPQRSIIKTEPETVDRRRRLLRDGAHPDDELHERCMSNGVCFHSYHEIMQIHAQRTIEDHTGRSLEQYDEEPASVA